MTNRAIPKSYATQALERALDEARLRGEAHSQARDLTLTNEAIPR